MKLALLTRATGEAGEARREWASSARRWRREGSASRCGREGERSSATGRSTAGRSTSRHREAWESASGRSREAWEVGRLGKAATVVATAEDGRPEVTGSGCYNVLVD